MNILYNILQVIGIAFIFEIFAYSMFEIALKLFTGINFKTSLYDSSTNKKDNISNKIASTIIASFFFGIHFLLGIIVLGVFFAI